MNESGNYTEFVVAQKAEGSWKTKRILLICLYVGFSIAWLGGMVGLLKLWPLGMFTPLFTIILIFFTWRYVSVEHEYIIVSGTITFTEIYGGRSRRQKLECKIKDFEKIAPMTDEYKDIYAAKDITAVYDFRGSTATPDAYFAAFRTKDGKKAVVYFEATAKALKIFQFYNRQGTVMSTTLRY